MGKMGKWGIALIKLVGRLNKYPSTAYKTTTLSVTKMQSQIISSCGTCFGFIGLLRISY